MSEWQDTYVLLQCVTCGVKFMADADLMKRKMKSKENRWYCTNGHPTVWCNPETGAAYIDSRPCVRVKSFVDPIEPVSDTLKEPNL